MGYDFVPKNKAAGDYHIGAFSWPFMLEAGLGLVFGSGEGFKPGEFIYITRADGKCVNYNDGARVSREEAKELAKVARWIARIQEARIKQWAKVPSEERARMEQDNKLRESKCMSNIYKLPWHPNAVQRFVQFAEWAEKSGGFTIE